MFGGSKAVVGVDIGNSSIKVAFLKKGASGPQLVSYGVAPLPHEGIIVDGAIVDSEKVSEIIKELIKSSKIKPSSVVLGLSSQNVIIRFINVPSMKDDELKEAIKFEAEQYVPYAIEEVSITYSKLDEIQEDGMAKIKILLVCAQKEILSSYTQTLKKASIPPTVIDINSIGTVNALHSYITEDEVVAVIDIGAGSTNVSLFSRGVMMFHRNIPTGGNNITSVIQNILKLDFEQAENVKKEQGKVVIDENEENEVSEVISTIIEELSSEIRRSFDYFKAQTREPQIHKIILSGGTSRLGNLDVYFENELAIGVETADPLQGIDVAVPDPEQLEEYKLELSAAIGLALREVM